MNNPFDDLWFFNRPNILENKIYKDPNLLSLENDKRLGLALLVKIEGECQEKIAQIIQQIKTIEPDQYYYPLSDLHVTITDLIVAHDNFVFDADLVERYVKIIEKIFQKTLSFDISFNGVIATKGAVILKAEAEKILKIRKKIERELTKNGIFLNERFQRDFVHSTIARFRQNLKNPPEFVHKIEQLQNFNIGALKANKILFVLHDWYNSKGKTKVLKEFELK